MKDMKTLFGVYVIIMKNFFNLQKICFYTKVLKFMELCVKKKDGLKMSMSGLIYLGVDVREYEDEENNEYREEAVDPINDTYEMKEKPNENEYPIVVHYDNYHKNVLWMSLNKLREK